MLSRSDLLTLLTINFIVVTKGAERISEVSARFTLDAMPGKQMAIDADLNAGLINQAQAQTRRKDVASEADFYGAMDGASKFVRGDAIAGMMILAINLIGGVCIGIFKYNLSADAAFQQYVLMTIGDGLVAQIPSLLLSTAAAIIVTRVSDNGDIAHDVRNQLLASPSVLYTATGIMFVLAVVPGMPHFPFLMFSALLGFTGWRMSKRPQAAEAEEKSLETLTRTMTETSEQQVSWETIPLIEPISLSLGYKLVALVDKAQGNPLTQRIRGVRQVISDGNGVLLPEICALQSTASGNFDFPKAWTSYFPIFDMIARHIGNVETEIGLDHWPNIYCGVAVFLFFLLYLACKKISVKEKAVYCGLLLLFFASFSMNVLNFIWHGFHYPNSLPCRQSFIYIFLMLFICFRAYAHLDETPKKYVAVAFWGSICFVLLAEKLVTDDAFEPVVWYVAVVLLLLYLGVFYF